MAFKSSTGLVDFLRLEVKILCVHALTMFIILRVVETKIVVILKLGLVNTQVSQV